jgi:hypothetical protein
MSMMSGWYPAKRRLADGWEPCAVAFVADGSALLVNADGGITQAIPAHNLGLLPTGGVRLMQRAPRDGDWYNAVADARYALGAEET